MSRKATSSSPTPVPEERLDLRIMQALRQIMRATDIHSRRLKSTHKLTTPQLVCLLTIANEGPLTATKIADRIFLSASTVVGILDRLEARGLIQRLRDTEDRRLVNVSATGKGLQVAKEAPSPLQAGLESGLQKLSVEEQATIARSLELIVDLMQAKDIEASPVLTNDDINDEPEENDPSPS